jgi:hypothetical protein
MLFNDVAYYVLVAWDHDAGCCKGCNNAYVATLGLACHSYKQGNQRQCHTIDVTKTTTLWLRKILK